MKSLLGALLLLPLVLLSSFSGLAQKQPALPGNLKPDSSVKEILLWLDQGAFFRNARIVLKDSRDDFIYRPPWDDSEAIKHTFIFTQGFRVTNIEGCDLMLRHDDAHEVIKSKLEPTTYPLEADLWVQLHRMSPDKGKRPHRYTRNAKKASLLGAWKTEFKYKGWASKTMAELKLKSPTWDEPQKWQGYEIAFTFDTKELTEQFDTAFRQAIKLCRSK